MDINKEKIIEISNEITEKLGFFVVDFSFRGDRRKPIIEVFVDASEIVTADKLADISREINTAIEENNLIDKSYRLDVSTPGVDRPLKFIKQFPKHINRKFEITYKLNGEIKTVIGKLLSVEKEELTFLTDGKNILINFNSITTAKVIISFS
jgi:ribosome maturation factor RimP